MKCNNCNSINWAAKNDDFCTDCEYEWNRQVNLVFRHEFEGANPDQSYVDSVLENYWQEQKTKT